MKPPDHTLPLTEPIPEDFMAEEKKVISIWLNYWHHRDQEEKKLLRGNQEISFHDILDLRAAIVRELKEEKREDFIGTLWEGFCMAHTRAKKGVNLALQEKEGLEQLKASAKTETVKIIKNCKLLERGQKEGSKRYIKW